MEEQTERDRAGVAERFGIEPLAPHFDLALTHPSYANEQGVDGDNQRLEFLGDAVLGFCTSEFLFNEFPDADEGTLTRLRARLVNAGALARWGRATKLPDVLKLGRGASQAGLGASKNVVADAVEALIAASFLDGGLDAARRVVGDIVRLGLEHEGGARRDSKSELQERTQARGEGAPTYRVVETGGPGHARWFEVEVVVGERALGRGRGSSKRQAEFAAAREALADMASSAVDDEEENR